MFGVKAAFDRFMKPVLIAIFLSLAIPQSGADDIADAKAAFAALQEYQKEVDIRSLDLFATNCTVTLAVTDGTNRRTLVVPDGKFRAMLTNAIARKEGNSDVYEDAIYTQEGSSVRMSCTVLFADSGKRGPLTLLYLRDSDGKLRIKEMKITKPVEKLATDEAPENPSKEP
jgi:hypothetical protein